MSTAVPTLSAPRCELPRSRQTMLWMTEPVRFLRSLQERHGDVFAIHLLRETPWVVVSDPEHVKQVLAAPGHVLHAGEPKRILEPLLGPESVLLTDEETHMRHRRLLLPPFHGARLGRYEERMRAIAAAEVERWPRGEATAAAPGLSAIAREVILRTVFGLSEDGQLGELRDALADLTDQMSTRARAALVALGDAGRLRDDRFADFRRLLERVDRLVLAEVAARRAAGEARRDDVLSMLLQVRYEDGSPIPDRVLRDQIMSLLIAGYETTANTLAWALERLVRHPQALVRVTAEAEAGGGPYTDAAIKETLRLRPVFMHLARLAREPFRVGGFEVPAGSTVAVGIPLVHRRPDVYPEPDAFRPERFLDRTPETYAWIPFGGGVHRCIGAGFAMLEMRAVLSTLLQRATLSAPPSAAPEPATRRLLVMAPGAGAKVVLKSHPS